MRSHTRSRPDGAVSRGTNPHRPRPSAATPPRRTQAGRESCRACGTDDDVAGPEERPCRRIAAPRLTSTERDAHRGQTGTTPGSPKSDNSTLATHHVNEMDGTPAELHARAGC